MSHPRRRRPRRHLPSGPGPRPKVKVRRMVFHEITREAIRGRSKPRAVDDKLVRPRKPAAFSNTLRIHLSLLWKKIAYGFRPTVQSAVRLWCPERERGPFAPPTGTSHTGSLVRRSADWVARGPDRDREGLREKTGTRRGQKVVLLDEPASASVTGSPGNLAGHRREKPASGAPRPVHHLTLQQEANRKLRLSARDMQWPRPYENGYITYMRAGWCTYRTSHHRRAVCGAALWEEYLRPKRTIRPECTPRRRTGHPSGGVALSHTGRDQAHRPGMISTT
jgi:DNA topoisomerase-1